MWVEGRGRMRKGTKQEGQDVLGAEQWGEEGVGASRTALRWHRPPTHTDGIVPPALRGGSRLLLRLGVSSQGIRMQPVEPCPGPRASHLSEQLLALHWAAPAGPPAPPPPRRHMHRPDLTDAARNDPQLPANSIHFNDKQSPGGGRRPRPEMLQEAYPTDPSEVRPPRSPDISGFPPVTST